MLWIDKHRPTELKKMEAHRTLTKRLSMLAEKGDFPHLLLYGPSGSGKKTRMLGFLREVFGPSVEKVKRDQHTIALPSGKKLDVEVLGSNHHIELTPSDAGVRDRVVVQEMVKQVAETAPIDAGTGKQSLKAVVLHDVDRMTRDAQQSLRRTMEKYMSTCRMILICESCAQVIDPVLSRCVSLRIGSPSDEEVVNILNRVASKEFVPLPEGLAIRIATAAKGNIRRALLMLETCRVEHLPLTSNQQINLPDWEVFVSGIANEIIGRQSPQTILSVREKVYQLLVNCIPPDVILRNLVVELLFKIDSSIKPIVAEISARYEERLKRGSKPIYHIEAFIVSFMCVYQKYLVDQMPDDIDMDMLL